MILNIMYYIITSILILTFLFKEKFVSDKINEYTDVLLKKTKTNEKIDKINRKYIQYVIYALVVIITLIFVFKVDKSVDPNVSIKRYAVYIICVGNIIGILINKKQYVFLVLNFAFIFASGLMFNIYDNYYITVLLLSLICNQLNILLNRETRDEEIKKVHNGLYVFLLIVIIQTSYLGNYVIPTGSMLPTIQLGDRIFSNNMIYSFKQPKRGDIISFKEPIQNRVMYTKRITGTPGTSISINAKGELLSDGHKISNRLYEQGGYLGETPVYIPKKGDEIILKQVIKFRNEDKAFVSILTPEEFYNETKGMDYKSIIGRFTENSNSEYLYDIILQVPGEMYFTLPILDFKYDNKLIERLALGETIKLKENYYIAMGDNSAHSLDSRYFGNVSESRIKGKLLFRWYPLNRIGIVR